MSVIKESALTTELRSAESEQWNAIVKMCEPLPRTRDERDTFKLKEKIKEKLHSPRQMPTRSLNKMKSQKTFGKAANQAKMLQVIDPIYSTGFLPILSDKTPPINAPTSQPANRSEVEMVPSRALSQTKSNYKKLLQTFFYVFSKSRHIIISSKQKRKKVVRGSNTCRKTIREKPKFSFQVQTFGLF